MKGFYYFLPFNFLPKIPFKSAPHKVFARIAFNPAFLLASLRHEKTKNPNNCGSKYPASLSELLTYCLVHAPVIDNYHQI